MSTSELVGLTKDELDVTMGAGPALTHARSLYLNSILLHPNDINPGVTIDVLTLDDDDNDLILELDPSRPRI